MDYRSCDKCSVCCEILEIPTLKKPKKTLCANVCSGGGCSIYQDRPDECRTFQCIWSEGYTGDGQRPDKSGIMASVAKGDLPAKTGAAREFLVNSLKMLYFIKLDSKISSPCKNCI